MKTGFINCTLLGLIVGSAAAWADDRETCDAGKGSNITGKVTSGPKFKSGKFLKDVELSHTHLNEKVDGTGDIYDVAIDNVFATGRIYQDCSKRQIDQ